MKVHRKGFCPAVGQRVHVEVQGGGKHDGDVACYMVLELPKVGTMLDENHILLNDGALTYIEWRPPVSA